MILKGTNAKQTKTLEFEGPSNNFCGLFYPNTTAYRIEKRIINKSNISAFVSLVSKSSDLNHYFGISDSSSECIRWLLLVVGDSFLKLNPFTTRLKQFQKSSTLRARVASASSTTARPTNPTPTARVLWPSSASAVVCTSLRW